MDKFYRVARGTIRIPRKGAQVSKYVSSAQYIKQGEVLPPDLFAQDELDSLLASGKIELIPQSQELEARQSAARPRGKWSVDPSALAGKSHEELIVMVMEIDPDFDVSSLVTVADAARQLTHDWNPAFRNEVTKSNDRSRPERLTHDGAKDKGNKSLSEQSEATLAKAKEAAAQRLADNKPKPS